MNTNTNELDSFKRRGFLKLLSGAVVTSIVGIPTGSAATSYIHGEAVNSLSLSKLFNLQGINTGSPTGLIFYLKNELVAPTQHQFYKDGDCYQQDVIPTINLSFDKTTVMCDRLQVGDVTNAIKLFIDEVLNTLSPINYNLHDARLSIAASSRRGLGNCMLLHTSRQIDNFEDQVDPLMTFVYSDYIPEDKCIMWYNGHEFYDGVITIAHDKENINNYLLVIHDCLPKYCRLITL